MANPPRIRNYQDLRYKFIRGLTRHEHQQRRHQFLKQAAEWTSKAIVSLSLAAEPIRSAKQATQLEGVGAIIRSRLDKIQAENNIKADPPKPGQHVSTGAGLLVALLNESEAIGSSEGGKPLVPEPDLKEACQLICEEKFNKIQASADGAPVLCTAWWRIHVLISRGFIKKRTRGKQAVYELLPEGEQIAKRLRGNYPPPVRIRNLPPLPQSPVAKGRKKTPSKKTKTAVSETTSGNSCTTSSTTSNFQGPLYCHDRGTDGVLMLVDDHELGGDRIRLGELSRRLKEWDIQHKTTHLPCGDYLWLWRQNGKEVALPILVERKRADDLADSMKDGRFWSQREKMIQWREEFGMLSDEVSLQYVVESTPEAYRVKCMDGCNGVGKCGNPTVQQVEVAIKEIETSKDFNLIKTENIEVTVEYLASLTAELQQRVSNGDFQVLRLKNRSLPLADMRSKSTTANKNTLTSTSTNNSSGSPKITQAPKRHMATSSNEIYSPKRAGEKRHFEKHRPRYVPINVDDVIEETPKKKKIDVDVELLDDSQDDYLLFQSPFDDSSNPSKNKPSSFGGGSSYAEFSASPSHAGKSKYTRPFSPRSDEPSSNQPINHRVQTNTSHDEEAKIVAVRDVMPDASLEEVLSALSSSSGNIDLAVAKLLDKHTTEERYSKVKNENFFDLT